MSSWQHQQVLDKESHVSFLEKKKAEILARKKQQEAASVAVVKTEEAAAPKKALPFANDGSFMERFKAMQKKQPSSQPPPPPPPQVKREVQPPEPPKSVSKTAKTYEPTKLALVFKEEAYEAAQHDQERARELAEKVAREGPDAEALALSDPSYSFLLEPKHTLAKFYKSELKRCRNEQASRKRRWNEQLRSSTSTKASSSSSTASSSSATAGSSSSSAPVNPLTEFEKAKALVRAKAAALMGGVVPPVVDSEEEKRKQKAVEEQKMMNAIYEKVIQQQIVAAMEASAKREEDKPKYEYDSDEDTEGGTWEHKKRHHEMMKTLEWAKDLTESGSGKHHLSDFLPPDELDKFMEKVKAVKEGREVDFSDYVKFKIQEDNIGFKMLQKAGWKEGEGLGAKGEGIVNPINKGKVSFDQSGVGTESVAEVKEDDDDFDLYRKRMMLAYKFRPNPLNNPRRPYYS